ncbi:MAG: dipeptidase [Chitinophagaceae bacterium]|nr:dipeptidase [Chitinophagaceae bacterium]
MRIGLLIISVMLSHQITAQSWQKIHAEAIVVDTHNDILMKATDDVMMNYQTSEYVFDKDLKGKTHTDLARWKQGGLDVQVFSVFCEGTMKNPYQQANRQMDTLDAVIARHPDKIIKVTSYAELLKAVKQHKIAALSGVEGGHMIEDDLAKLEVFYSRGAKYLTLTWNNSTSWATSAYDETFKKDLTHKGLTDFGKQVVQRMNQLGMIVDISHVGEQSFWDVINTTSKPVMASHSDVYNLCRHQRNLKDEQIRAIAKNGGVIQVNFNTAFIDSTAAKKEYDFFQKHKAEQDSLVKAGRHEWNIEDYLFAKYRDEADATRPPLSMVIQHIEYIINLVGVDYVGLGSDFDGITNTPQQLDDVTAYPFITKALVEKGYSKKDIAKILGGNFLRVLKANEAK